MRNAGHLKIGPLRWDLLAPDGQAVRYSAPAYRSFFSPPDAPADREALVCLPVRLSRGAFPPPAGEPAFQAGDNWAAWEAGDEWLFCSGFHRQPHARFTCRADRKLGWAELAIDPAWGGAEGVGWENPLRYPMDQILAWGLLGPCGGVLMHAAAAVKDGEGWVFAGRSGAGKSTLSALCRAEGWDILNDDRVIVYPRDGRMMVAGTPWHGSGRFAEAREVPLGGIFLLQHAAEDRVEALDSTALLRALLDVSAVPWFDPDWSERTLNALERLPQRVECARLNFTPSASAVRLLQSRLRAVQEVLA